MGEKACTYSFLQELLRRTSPVPINLNCQNQCVRIDMTHCSKEFILQSEHFLTDNKDRFRVIARGVDLYLEVKNCDTYRHAFEKACLEEQILNS